MRGLYRYREPRPSDAQAPGADPRQRHRDARGARGAGAARRRSTTSPPTCGARRATSCCARTRSSVERWNRLHPTEPPRVPYVTEQLGDSDGPDRRGHRLHEVRARPDRALRARSRSSRSAPTASGSPTPAPALRRHFEIDAAHIVGRGARRARARRVRSKREVVAEAITRFDIDPDRPDPAERRRSGSGRPGGRLRRSGAGRPRPSRRRRRRRRRPTSGASSSSSTSASDRSPSLNRPSSNPCFSSALHGSGGHVPSSPRLHLPLAVDLVSLKHPRDPFSHEIRSPVHAPVRPAYGRPGSLGSPAVPRRLLAAHRSRSCAAPPPCSESRPRPGRRRDPTDRGVLYTGRQGDGRVRMVGLGRLGGGRCCSSTSRSSAAASLRRRGCRRRRGGTGASRSSWTRATPIPPTRSRASSTTSTAGCRSDARGARDRRRRGGLRQRGPDGRLRGDAAWRLGRVHRARRESTAPSRPMPPDSRRTATRSSRSATASARVDSQTLQTTWTVDVSARATAVAAADDAVWVLDAGALALDAHGRALGRRGRDGAARGPGPADALGAVLPEMTASGARRVGRRGRGDEPLPRRCGDERARDQHGSSPRPRHSRRRPTACTSVPVRRRIGAVRPPGSRGRAGDRTRGGARCGR